MKIFREHGRGWGLRASEDVKKGQLVFEYVGEVIDDEELHVRTRTTQPDRHIGIKSSTLQIVNAASYLVCVWAS